MRTTQPDVSVLLLSAVALLSRIGCAGSYAIRPFTWDYRGHEIACEVSHPTADGDDDDDDGGGPPARRRTATSGNEVPILLLNGFGVGSFHQHRLIPELLVPEEEEEEEGVEGARRTDDRVVYCIDYLGQGASWPRDCEDGLSENERGLIYSAETWLDQIGRFVEEVIPEGRVHVVGNSVGGHLAAHLAHRRPDLVETVCLLNPTPVWGLNLPGWSGRLPPPRVPRAIGRYLFDKIRDLGTIERYLGAAYFREGAFDETLMNQIRGCTLGTGGHAAFASILWSPPLLANGRTKDFQECLAGIDCGVLLIFGRDDPWCKPAFAKKMLRALNGRSEGGGGGGGRRTTTRRAQRYVEVANCGHCPNHEAPRAVGRVVGRWVDAADRAGATLVRSGGEIVDEAWGPTPISERREEDIELGLLDRAAVTFV